MATMNISLPDQMKKWIEEQVAGGRYANASDYMRDLIRQEQDGTKLRKAAITELQALIDEGLEGEVTDVDFDTMRDGVKQELGLGRPGDAA